MPRLLSLLGDAEGRLICSECRKQYGDDMERLWLFERYRDADGQQVNDAARFQLRKRGTHVDWREDAPRHPDWSAFPGGTVFCVDPGCSLRSIGNYRVYDPATGEEGAL